MHVGRMMNRDRARQGVGATVEQCLKVSEGPLREQVDLARSLDVADVDLDGAEVIALDVEGLPTRPQNLRVLGEGEDISPGSSRQTCRDVHERSVLDLEKHVLRGVQDALSGHVLFELEVESAIVGRSDAEDVSVTMVEDHRLVATRVGIRSNLGVDVVGIPEVITAPETLDDRPVAARTPLDVGGVDKAVVQELPARRCCVR